MAKAKIDFAALKVRFKDFMLAKGERVGLVACLAIAVLLIGTGVWSGLTSSRPPEGDTWQKVLEKKANEVKRMIDNGNLKPEKEKEVNDKVSKLNKGMGWPITLTSFKPGQLVAPHDTYDVGRRNPVILPILDGPKDIQMDYMRGGVVSYKLNLQDRTVTRISAAGEKGGAAKETRLVTTLRPERMVVVNCVFPMKDQLEIYRSALRIASYRDLFEKDVANIPVFLGLNVYRCEILPDGTPMSNEDGSPAWEYLTRYNTDKDAIEVADEIRDLLRRGLWETDTQVQYADYLRPGAAGVLPMFANAKYPPVKLEGVEGNFTEDKKIGGVTKLPEMPWKKFKDKSGELDQVVYTERTWADIRKDPKGGADLVDKFEGKISYFDPFAAKPEKEKDKTPDKKDKKDKKDFLPAANTEFNNVLVRFFDPGVKPGKTYRYCVQVRMQSPNYQHKDAAHKALAEIKDLYSPFTVTPEIRIPDEYFFYAVDQKPKNKIKWGSDTNPPDNKGILEQTPLQVQTWVPEITVAKEGEDIKIADWAIAERLLTRRGDYVGRNGVYVEVASWSEKRDGFEVHVLQQRVPKGKPVPQGAIGIPIDFQGNPPSLVVDFAGGKGAKNEESAVEVLFLTPDGKLEVRNSRIDSADDTQEGRERADRYSAWDRRLRDVRDGGSGPAMPTGKEK